MPPAPIKSLALSGRPPLASAAGAGSEEAPPMIDKVSLVDADSTSVGLSAFMLKSCMCMCVRFCFVIFLNPIESNSNHDA